MYDVFLQWDAVARGPTLVHCLRAPRRGAEPCSSTRQPESAPKSARFTKRQEGTLMLRPRRFSGVRLSASASSQSMCSLTVYSVPGRSILFQAIPYHIILFYYILHHNIAYDSIQLRATTNENAIIDHSLSFSLCLSLSCRCCCLFVFCFLVSVLLVVVIWFLSCCVLVLYHRLFGIIY